MAKGRKNKPTALKILAGNPGRRKLNDQEPEPDVILPVAPETLSNIGKAKWDEVSLKLYNQGILTELDLDLLMLYCQNYEGYVDAKQKVKDFGGEVVKTDKGNLMQNPFLSIANQREEKMIKMLSMFGMSPVDRTKVKSSNKKAKPKSLAEKFFNAPVTADRK